MWPSWKWNNLLDADGVLSKTEQDIVMLMVFVYMFGSMSGLCLRSLRKELSLSSAFDQFQPFRPNQPYLCLPIMCVCAESLQLCPTLCDSWEVARQVPLSMGFSKQAYWSGLPCCPPGDIPNLGIEPTCPAPQADSWLLSPQRNLFTCYTWSHMLLIRFVAWHPVLCNRLPCRTASGAENMLEIQYMKYLK